MDQLSFNNINDGIFDRVYINYNGTLQNIVDLIGGGGGGGSIISAVSPLNLTNNVLTLGAFPSSGINILDSNSTNHIISVNTSSQLLLDGNVISGGGGGGGGSLSFTLPLSESNNVVSTLFKPSTVSSTNGSLQLTPNDTAGTLNITVNPTLELTNLQFNYQGTIKNLTTSASNLIFDGHDVTTNTYLNTQLATKQDNLTFIMNGVTQSNITGIDFKNNNGTATGGVLKVSRLTEYDKIPLINTNSVIKDLYQDTSGNLIFGTDTVAMASSTTSYTFTLPLRETSGTVETLFKPSTVSANQGITLSANDSTGTLLLTLDGTESRTALKLEDSGGTVRDLTASVTGSILYNGSVLTDLTYVQNQLSTKQDTITATLPLQISSNTISTLWKPSQITTGTGSGLSHIASDTLGTLLIQCTGDEERAQVKLTSPNTTVTEITADNSLNLLWGGSSLALQSWVTSQLINNYQPKIRFYWTVAPTGNISGQFVDEIYYDTGLNVNYTLNTQTNKNELHIEAEVTQAELNLKQDDLGLTLSNGAITGADKIHLGITNGNSRLHLLGDNTVSTDILHRIELGVGQGDILTVKKFANVGYIGIRQYNPSEALEVNGNIRIETGKLMLMNSTAEGIQSQGNIKLESGAGIDAFSDMQSTENSKFTCGNIQSSDGKHYNKIALYEEVGAIKNKYFRGFGFYEYSAGNWSVGIYGGTGNNYPKLHQGSSHSSYVAPTFYVTDTGAVNNSRSFYIDAWGAGSNQAELYLKYATSPGASTFNSMSMFANSSYSGINPNSTNFVIYYPTTGSVGLQMTSSSVTTINGTVNTPSDQRLKEDIETANYDDCERAFKNIDVKTYRRNDINTDKYRLGLIAQEVEANIDNDKWSNIVSPFEMEGHDETLKGVDYSRMVCILWGYCKKLETRVKQLERQININS
jgi:hypothetical protein